MRQNGSLVEIDHALSDLDGTLMPLGSDIVPTSACQAVADVQDRGVPVFAVTGRCYPRAKTVAQAAGLHHLGVVDDGATIRNFDTDEILYQRWLSPDRVKKLTEAVLPYALELSYNEDFDHHVPRTDELDADFRETPFVWVKVPVAAHDDLMGRLANIPNISFHPTLWPDRDDGETSFYTFQMTDSRATKRHGIGALYGLLGAESIKPGHGLGIGDGNNDLPLFEAAGVGVAMGNAVPRLINMAHYITDTVANHGYALAMNRLILDPVPYLGKNLLQDRELQTTG